MKLSQNFSLEELIEAGSARRLGLQDQFNPSPEIVNNLKLLVTHVLQPLRDAVAHPITVTSGYRSPKVNKAVGGSKKSQHLEGKAGDIQLWVNGVNRNQLLYDTVLKLKLPFCQMIDEFGEENAPAWIHISYDAKNNKKECLRARKVNNKTVYTKL